MKINSINMKSKKIRACSDKETNEKVILLWRNIIIKELNTHGFMWTNKKDILNIVDKNINRVYDNIKKSNRAKNKTCNINLKSDYFDNDFENTLIDYFVAEIQEIQRENIQTQLDIANEPIFWLTDLLSNTLPSIETVSKILGESDAISYRGSLENLENSELFDIEPKFRAGKYRHLFNIKQINFCIMYVELAANENLDEIRDLMDLTKQRRKDSRKKTKKYKPKTLKKI